MLMLVMLYVGICYAFAELCVVHRIRSAACTSYFSIGLWAWCYTNDIIPRIRMSPTCFTTQRMLKIL